MIWDFIFYHIPFWLQVTLLAIPVAVAFWFAIQIFGWEKVRGWIAPALAVLAALGLLSRARQQGYGDRQVQEKQADTQVTTEFDKIHKVDEGLSDKELDKKNAPWLKDDPK